MKRTVILFLINLSLTTAIFSQNISYPRQISDSTVEITSKQLKNANLIFIEHKSLKEENKELNIQVQKYQDLVNNFSKQDSINKLKIHELTEYSKFANDQIIIKDNQINKLSKKKDKYKVLSICGISISVLSVLGIILMSR